MRCELIIPFKIHYKLRYRVILNDNDCFCLKCYGEMLAYTSYYTLTVFQNLKTVRESVSSDFL